MIDFLVIILMVIALVLFVLSRYQLGRTTKSMAAHNYAQELYNRVSKAHGAGKTKEEIIAMMKKDYGLDEDEAEYIYHRTPDIQKEDKS
ncbi:hypothetical protein [Salinicoccus roseus]|uniref:hypothetical protein n=1 Tax=Salinicoccus roseus TaxID=45670 RepID=UPI000F4DF5E0|nr:hypothetical protein [Salinicoccus roseus]RPE51031.1 hypothetical protein EDC33_2384 [Salinicoccus roseus]GGA78560.1 hypothetical protein GCM10007176_23590 [Salinicoccus roseus]